MWDDGNDEETTAKKVIIFRGVDKKIDRQIFSRKK